MLSIPELAAALGTPASKFAELEVTRDYLVDLWEKETHKLWGYRASHVEEFVVESPPRPSVYLDLRPVAAIVKVEEKDFGASTWSTVTSGFELVDGYVLRRTTGNWCARVRVTYDGGYSAEPTGNATKTPPEIARVLLLQARFEAERFGPEKVGARSVAVEGATASYETATLHPMVAAAAERNRRRA